MRAKPLILALSMIILFSMLSIACGLTPATQAPADPTATTHPTNPPEPAPTDIPTAFPTAVPTSALQVAPTNPPAPIQAPVIEDDPQTVSYESEPYYIEEFDSPPQNWTYYLFHGEDKDYEIYTQNGELIFDLRGPDQYLYYLYDDYIYDSVYLQTLADNRGQNHNNVSLICNYTPDEGWYEFNVYNSGLYDILVYSVYHGEYRNLYNGGSKNINSGRAENTYSVVCDNHDLELYINGILERKITDKTYRLPAGQVGVSVSSFNDLPIKVEFDYVMIDVP